MSKTIFYSWQSDLPNSINRGFIQDCLDRAIDQLNKTGELIIDFDIDRDTLDRTGSPDIVHSIFDKIDKCQIFIGDVSIINQHDKSRKTPNPNVLTELGWAAARKSWDSILCVFNLCTGDPQALPFDLRSRRVITYSLNEGEDKAAARKELIGKFASNITSIVQGNVPRLAKQIIDLLRAINPVILTHIRDGVRRMSINVSVKNELVLQELMQSPHFSELVNVRSNMCFLGNNTCGNGGINDVGPGTLNGYNFEITEVLALYVV
jgi:hypothetical protein